MVAHERDDEGNVYPTLAKVLTDGHGLSAMSRAHREILHLARLLARLVEDLPAERIDRYLIRDAQRVIESIETLVRIHTRAGGGYLRRGGRGVMHVNCAGVSPRTMQPQSRGISTKRCGGDQPLLSSAACMASTARSARAFGQYSSQRGLEASTTKSQVQ